MNARPSYLFLGLSAVVLAAGCASSPPDKTLESGFLTSYSQLRERDCVGAARIQNAGTCYIWDDPRLTPQNYNAVILERLAFFPEPKPNEYVTLETLDKIRNYMDNRLREEMGKQVNLVNTPGPGVVRIRWAITAASAETRSLEVYQYIPVALVATAAVAVAEGGLPKDAKIAFEAEVTDSLTRQPLFLTLRTGTGQRIQEVKSGQRQINPDNLKKLFDAWSEGVGAGITHYIKAK